jgi:Polycystin cation channel
VKLLKYTSTGDYALMACEIMFCLYILYYIVEEVLEMKVHGITYLFSFGNILDIVVIGVQASKICFFCLSGFWTETQNKENQI